MLELTREFPAGRPEAWVQLKREPKGLRVFAHQIQRSAPRLQAGAQVALLTPEKEIWGWGLYQPRSRIRVRVLRRGPQPADPDWVRQRLQAALQRRFTDPGFDETWPAYRILHAEGDDFPGLIMDRYGDTLSAQLFTASALPFFELAWPLLKDRLGLQHYWVRLEKDSAKAEGYAIWEERSAGFPTRVEVLENSLRFEIFFEHGHKTGFFCDQRTNRRLLGQACADARVLDVCCYTGGFALNAAAGGAAEVLALDLDEKAIAQAQRNAHLNVQRVSQRKIRFVHTDAFSYLRTLGRNQKQFDVIVLDPPKFIPNRKEEQVGIARYYDLNKLAMPLLTPGGLLLTCSCSGLLPLQEFRHTLRRAAWSAGRRARVIRVAGHEPDHPTRLDFPEGEYLKAFWLRVD